jgi:hypothetical protein
MKLTNKQIKQIIKEEIEAVLDEAQPAPTGRSFVYFDPSGNIELQKVTKTGGSLSLPKSLVPANLYNYMRRMTRDQMERGMGQKAAEFLINSLFQQGYREEASSIDVRKLSTASLAR